MIYKVQGVYADMQKELTRLGCIAEDGDTILLDAQVNRTSAVGPDIDRDEAVWTIEIKKEHA